MGQVKGSRLAHMIGDLSIQNVAIKKAEPPDPAFPSHGKNHGYKTRRNGVNYGIFSSPLPTQ
jgi:hypothetical protein